ncbi:BA14K family protein [Microvirga sp. G4-2]|uniref:BA14K family protein n=1 Tax=Microvirga sp. G4-2 TaxID=3434467 RepID=UPI004044FAB1
MRKMLMALAATAALGTFGLNTPASAVEAQAAPVNELVAAIQKGDVKSDYVQYRRYYYRGGPRYVERRYYGRPYYGRRYGYYRRDRGNALAAGALGLATGAIIGGAIAQSQAAPVYRGNAYCAQRYRSYDPASGTYLGYDGLRHPCP